jgi:hypothetical protein
MHAGRSEPEPSHSLFALPKAFVGQTATIQRSALRSWLAIPGVEVLLLGDDEGVSDVATDFGVSHIASVARSRAGAPLVSDVFEKAASWATSDSLIYVNADVLLPPFSGASIVDVRHRLAGALCVGQCRNVDVDRELAGWYKDLASSGRLRGPGGIDYLGFVRGTFESIPPFALGRAYYDNWLIWHAYRAGVPIVDLTEVLRAIHQNHDYGHVAGGRPESYEGVDARRNLALAGGRLHLFNIDDATHRMTPNGLRRNVLSPLRTFPPARWLALEPGRIKRALEGLAGR